MPLTAKGVWRHTELEVIAAIKKLNNATSLQIAIELNLHHKWVDRKIKILKDAGRVYISDWTRAKNAGDWRRVLALRTSDLEPDEPKPNHPAGSDVIKNRHYRARNKIRNLYERKLEHVAPIKSETTGETLLD